MARAKTRTRRKAPQVEDMLLDQFAMAALAGMCANPKLVGIEDAEIAEGAYSVAEAMLAERDEDEDDEDDED